MESPTVLVLDVVPQTLAVVRSLSRAGYHVLLGRSHSQKKSEVEWSRHCDEVWLHPDYSEESIFRNALIRLLDTRPEIRSIFPVAEPGIQILHAISDLQDRSIDVAMVSKHLFTACHDKALANDLATEAGLLVPESHVVTDIATLQKTGTSLGFPIIVKSVRSEAPVHGRKAYIVRSAEELKSAFSIWPAEHPDLLIQRYVEGKLESCQFVAFRGTLTGYCELDVLRSNMPDGTGLGIEFESVPPTPDILSALQNFVRAHDYSGPGLIQFIRAAQSNDLYFIENNPRLGAGIAHAIDSGQDCPALALRAAANNAAMQAKFNSDDIPYRYHYRSHWLLRDLRAWESLRPEFNQKQQIDWLKQLMRSFLRAHGHFVWQWRDPLPAVYVYGKLFRKTVAKLAGTKLSDG